MFYRAFIFLIFIFFLTFSLHYFSFSAGEVLLIIVYKDWGSVEELYNTLLQHKDELKQLGVIGVIKIDGNKAPEFCRENEITTMPLVGMTFWLGNKPLTSENITKEKLLWSFRKVYTPPVEKFYLDIISSLKEGELSRVEVSINGNFLPIPEPFYKTAGVVIGPLRPIYENLGGKVSWDEGLGGIVVNYPDRTIKFRLADGAVFVGNEKIAEKAIKIINKTYYVPLNIIATSLGGSFEKFEATGVYNLVYYRLPVFTPTPAQVVISIKKPAGNYLLIAEQKKKTIALMDTGAFDFRILGELAVEDDPEQIATSPQQDYIYVLNKGGQSISVFDGENFNQVGNFPLKKTPERIIFSKLQKIAYISESSSNTIIQLQLANLYYYKDHPLPTATPFPWLASYPIQACLYPLGIALSNDEATLFVACSGDNKVIGISLSTNIRNNITLPASPAEIYLSPSSQKFLYITIPSTGEMVIYDIVSKYKETIELGGAPTRIYSDEGEGKLYIVNPPLNAITIFREADKKIIDTFLVGSRPSSLAISPKEGRIYVANSKDKTISIIEKGSNELLKEIPLSDTPTDLLLYSPVNPK